VVRVYKDGSACICWDDGEPQEDGLGHERMPRELLKKVDGAKVAPAAAPAGHPECPAPRAPGHRASPARHAAAAGSRSAPALRASPQ
ncbi:MAG: hypothetical protein L6Q73_17115, partial [Aquabacterium sp.]|nr:hypothetical protein [Aquabacterium sp.]